MKTSETPKKQSLLARILFLLITLTVSGMGALSFFTSHAPARSTRFGIAGPLFGQVAQDFGLAIFVVGLFTPSYFRSKRRSGRLVFGDNFCIFFGSRVHATHLSMSDKTFLDRTCSLNKSGCLTTKDVSKYSPV